MSFIFCVNKSSIIIYFLLLKNLIFAEVDGKKDLVQPNEKHYDGIPKFIQEPLPIYYVNKTQPAKIICIAEPVSHANIFCAEKQFSYMGEEISESGLHVTKLNSLGKPDPNGKRWKFSLVVKFKDVVEWFSEYKCYCEAWNQIIIINKAKKVHSSAALIQESYFQNKFKKSPQSQIIKEGSRLLLSCVPPDAKPNAKITWLKNDESVTPLTFPLIITDQVKQLIIERVQKSDNGNYTCVAQSLGMVKKTKPAVITVTSKYYWSEWTDWIQCSQPCLGENACLNQLCSDKVRKRHRFCLFDGAKTNAENCKDESTEMEPCDIGCEQLDTKWKSWTKWSITCSPNCTQTRGRRCEIDICKGPKSQTRNCSQVLCQIKDRTFVLESQSTTMYLGLFVTIAVLFIIILTILCLITQKGYISMLPQRAIRFSSHNNGLIKYYGNKSSKSHKLLIGNEEKSTVVTIKNHNAQDIVATTLLSDCSNAYSPVYEMHNHNSRNQIIPAIYSEYPALSQSGFQYPLMRNGMSKERSYNSEVCNDSTSNDHKHRPSSALYQELSIGRGSCGILSNFLPPDIDLDTVAWGTISSSGGRLCLPQSGISLTIPRGVIHQSNTEEMFLAVCRDQGSIPAIDASEMLLSPLVLCGPPNIRLIKPIIITIPHCANYHSNDWNIRILSALYQNNQIPPLWKELSTIRPMNRLDTQIYAQLDPISTHLIISQPQMICITGKMSPISNIPVLIRLRLLAFSQTINSEPNHVIRIHMIPDTKEATENVIASELDLSGQLLDNCKKMSVSSSGDNITISLEELSIGWRCHRKFQVVSHSSIWKLNHTKSFESHFLLEHIDPSKTGFTCAISLQQLNEPQSRVNINVIKEKAHNQRLTIPLSESPIIDSEFPQTYLDPLQTVFRLSFAARQQLWPLLDPYWQTLANHMNLNGNLKYFEERISPTDALLDLWEARCREEGAISDLINSLRAIGRNDCAMIVEQELTK